MTTVESEFAANGTWGYGEHDRSLFIASLIPRSRERSSVRNNHLERDINKQGDDN